uniref:FAD dependent oxidoreductase domain protein n=1 Tax=Fischerella sp. ATCC 43239 TaxID=1535197 RepID=A0A076N4T9_9CYAN|nr:FAD dependent oxidoreductase domain protein [Fischerella sp. ATCC 43239]
MSKIAIIGSGINGMVAAHGLLAQGHKVSVYSALRPQDWLDKVPPSGTAARYPSALDIERELNLNHWEEVTPKIDGAHFTYCKQPGEQPMSLTGRVSCKIMAIDTRLQSYQWMHDFENRGGKIEIEEIDVKKLDEIANENDLTLVTTGKGGLSSLFERDEARSKYKTPQRQITMITVKNLTMQREGIPFKNSSLVANFFTLIGEKFDIPYWHKDGFQCWNLLFEAKEGREFDKFRNCKSGEEVVNIAKTLFKELMPWDYEWFKNAELADNNGWLSGNVTQCVKNPVSFLSSGKPVMALGDTAVALDPVGGQGANNGYRQIRTLLKAVKLQGDQPFTAEWMCKTFDEYYETIGKVSIDIANNFIDGSFQAGIEQLLSKYGSNGKPGNEEMNQNIVNLFVDGFDNPNLLANYLKGFKNGAL